MSAMNNIGNAPSVEATVAKQRFFSLILLKSNAVNGLSRARIRERKNTNPHQQNLSRMRARIYPLHALLFMYFKPLDRCLITVAGDFTRCWCC